MFILVLPPLSLSLFHTHTHTHTHTHPNIHRSGEKAEPGCGWAEAEVMGATVVLSWLLLSSQGSRKQSCQLRVRLGEEVLRKRNLKV